MYADTILTFTFAPAPVFVAYNETLPDIPLMLAVISTMSELTFEEIEP